NGCREPGERMRGDCHAACFIHGFHARFERFEHWELAGHEKSEKMALPGGDLVAWHDLEAPLALLGKLKGLHRAPNVVVVGNCNYVEVGMVLDKLENLLNACKPVAQRRVHMQVGFAPLDLS